MAVLLMLVVAFLATRVANLDSDLPPFKIAELQPIDEFFYTIPAFNLYHYGSMDHRVVAFIPTDGAPLNLLENVMTFGTLLAFGNNYYGLRMASVLAGLGVLLLLYFVLRRETPLGGAPTTPWLAEAVPLLWVAYLVADFAFGTMARVVEPTIFRLLGVAAVLFMASVWRGGPSSSSLRAFTFGLVAVSACLYIYIYNFFIIPAVLVMIFGESVGAGLRRLTTQVLWALAGCVAAILSFAAIVYLTYGESVLQLYQGTIQPFIGRVGNVGWFYPLVTMGSTNIFRFDLPLLVAFALALPIFAYRVVKERSRFGLLVATLLFFLVFQSYLLPDYLYKKLLMLSPLVILVISMAIPFVSKFVATIARNRVAFVATLGWLGIAGTLLFAIYNRVKLDLEPNFKRLSQVCIVLLILCLVAAYVGRGRFERSLTFAGIAMLIVPGLYFSAEHLYSNPTYRYRDAMIAAAPLLDHQVTAGGWSLAFRLYNTSVPVLNPYQYLYRRSGPKEYKDDLRRLFSIGTTRYTVWDSGGSPFLTDLGLERVASYEIDVEQTPVIAVFRAPGL
ncbi:MAG: hypothetical protein M3082_11500 [Candidatus Dormibacteraeota bacterium]|nr:hypothetical protein [Candidatus Dormibacteraeota bacterium]